MIYNLIISCLILFLLQSTLYPLWGRNWGRIVVTVQLRALIKSGKYSETLDRFRRTGRTTE